MLRQLQHKNKARLLSGRAFCLAEPDSVYAVYLPLGGTVTLNLPTGSRYQADWWDPAQGWEGTFSAAQSIDGGRQEFTAPTPADWALRVRKTSQ